MNLAIDLGTSSVKIGCFEDGVLVGDVQKPTFEEIIDVVLGLSPDRIIISSVNQNALELKNKLQGDVMILDHTTPLPIKVKYNTPKTLGKDRIAAVVAANIQQPNKDTLVVDVGSCITYDFINKKNEYIGGSISPGIEMKLRAMNTFTAELPLVSPDFGVELVGDTTEKALQSGTIYGTIAEIEEIVRMYKDKSPHLRFVICGGGAESIGLKLKTTVEIYPELVLLGLNGILEYNV
ncbi:MAG: type III pantothenate kinase [Cyclobacteriaceae bacterium]|nr:type III pantothenate kinase [Cyclobacteriaceae bacterium]